MGQSIIILNSKRVAKDLLDKRGATYSHRPARPMMSLVGVDLMTGASPYGERLRKLRSLILRNVGAPAIVQRNAPVSEMYTQKFILRPALRDPEHLAEHINKAAGALILRLQCGYEVQEGFDPMVDLSERTTHWFTRIVAPGSFLVDAIPLLRYLPSWFPGGGFHKIAQDACNQFDEFREVPFAFTKKQLAEGTAQPSFFADLLAEPQTPEEESLIKYAGNAIFAGGSDTTTSMIHSFFLAMVLYPSVQQKAQAELDAVVGTGRLPALSDRADLPYMRALVWEILRWHQVLPQGLPHKIEEDDVYEGMRIPKGSVLIANIWGMLHDPAVYKDPHVFRPERFLGPHPEADPTDVCFGFGRRVCPGEHIALSSVFLACAMALATLDISKIRDAQGNEITPLFESNSGLNVSLKSFPLQIKARSKEAEALINDIDSRIV